MSRYKPTPAQLRTLKAIAAGDVRYDARGVYFIATTNETCSRTTLRRLVLEDWLDLDLDKLGSDPKLTVLGESVLAALGGAS